MEKLEELESWMNLQLPLLDEESKSAFNMILAKIKVMKSETDQTVIDDKENGEYNVWDWIVTKDNRVLLITSDDMMGLNYEDILRHANEEEIETAIVSDLDNLEDAVEHVLPRFEGIERLKEFKSGEDGFASFCQSQLSGGIGMHIRNQLNLWDDTSKLHKHLEKNHKCNHPDDMSDLIIRHVYRIKSK